MSMPREDVRVTADEASEPHGDPDMMTTCPQCDNLSRDVEYDWCYNLECPSQEEDN